MSSGCCESCGREADLRRVIADSVTFWVCARCAAIQARPLQLPFPTQREEER